MLQNISPVIDFYFVSYILFFFRKRDEFLVNSNARVIYVTKDQSGTKNCMF
jgi:hypothetical protein